MAKFTALFSAVFLIISTAAGHLFPKNHELTYKYGASIKTSTNTPTVFTSELAAEATLIIKSYEGQVIATLKDVTYSMYNGKGSKVGHESKILEIPKESKSINLPFAMEYEDNGMVNAIITEANDESWSINIKKAIAATLQLDLKQILATDSSTSYAFYSEESTVYGKCNSFYTVFPQSESRLVITKHNDPTSCKGFKWESNINASPGICEEKFENPLAISSDRYYEVSKQGKGIFIDRVETANTIILTPFKSNSDSHSVLSNQTLRMIKYEELKDVTPEKVGKTYNKLKVQPVQYDLQKEVIYDMTGGRAVFNNEDTMNIAHASLETVLKNLEHTKTDFSDSIKLVDLEVHILYFQLRMLNFEYLEKLFSSLESSYKENKTGKYPIFLAALPHIGTYASHKLIKKIVAEQKLHDNLREEKLLRDLPFYIKYQDKKLIEELLPLTIDISLNVTTRNVAKLTVATVINKVLEKYPDDEEVQKYIDDFIKKFTTAEEYLDKLTYLGTLLNIGSKKTIKVIEKFIKEDKPGDQRTTHLRSIAIWGIKNKYVEDVDHFDKIFWPLLENEFENLQVRVAVMTILMYNPSADNLLKIHWYMQTVRDEELYKFYYGLLESHSGSTLPCFNSLAIRAKQILAITRKPVQINTRSYAQLADYFDSNFGFGAQYKTVAIGDIFDDKFTTLYHRVTPNVANLNLNQDALYIHIDASDDENITKWKRDGETVYEYYSRLIGLIIAGYKKLFEIIKFKNGKITSATIIRTNEHIFDNIDNRLLGMENEEPNYDIDQSVSGESIITTDVGITVMSYLWSPSTSQLKYSYEQRAQPNLKVKYAGNNNHMYGIMFYNPLVDTWQGTQRSMLSNLYFPLDFAVKQTGLIVNHTESKSYGFQSYVSSNVFVMDGKNDNKKLTTSCPKCSPVDIVTKKNEKTKTLWKSNLEFLGSSVAVELFNCEKEISDSHINNLVDQFTSDDNKNIVGNPLTELTLILRHIWAYITSMPTPGRCGVKFVVTPEHTLTNISFGRIAIPHSDEFYYNFKFEMFQDDIVKNWWGCKVVGDDWIRSKGNIHCTYKNDDKIYKLCLERKLEYGLEYNHESYFNFKIGSVNNAEDCPDDILINIKIDRPESYKRKSTNVMKEITEVCEKEDYTMVCVKKFLVSQNVSMKIDYKNIPSDVSNFINTYIIDSFKKEFYNHYVDLETEKTEKNNLKVSFYIDPKEFNMEYVSNSESFRLEFTNDDDYDVYKYLYYEIYPAFMSILDVTDSCEVGVDTINNYNFEKTSDGIPKEWTQIAAHECNCPEEWKLFAKQAERTDPLYPKDTIEYVIFRIESASDKLDIHLYTYRSYEIFLNDKLLKTTKDQEYVTEKWFDLKSFDSSSFAIVYLKNAKKLIIFDKEYRMVRVSLPKEYFTGKCQMDAN